jgi:hypothetical protein
MNKMLSLSESTYMLACIKENLELDIKTIDEIKESLDVRKKMFTSLDVMEAWHEHRIDYLKNHRAGGQSMVSVTGSIRAHELSISLIKELRDNSDVVIERGKTEGWLKNVL